MLSNNISNGLSVPANLRSFANHQIFLQLAEASSDVVVVADAKRRIIFVNQFACDRTGYQESELIGRRIPILYRKEMEAKVTALVHAELKRTGQWSGEVEVRRKDGTTFTTATRILALVDDNGKFAGTLGIGRDLTGERLLSQRLWHTGPRAENLLDALPDAVCVLDPQGTIQMCNSAFCSMLGYRVEEVVGAKPPYPWLEESDAGEFRDSLRALRRQRLVRNQILTWRRRDQSAVIVSLVLSAFNDENATSVAYVMSARDVTDVNYSEDLRRAREQTQRLRLDIVKKAVRLQTLQEVNAFVLGSRDLDKTFLAITSGIRKLVPHDLAGIYLYDPEKEAFLPHTLSKQTPFSRKLARFPIPLGEGIIGASAIMGEMIWVNNAQLDPRSKYPEGMRPAVEHFIAVPLNGRESVFGIFVVARNHDPVFIEEEALVVKSFADAASVALENARLYFELVKKHGGLSKPPRIKALGLKDSRRRTPGLTRNGGIVEPSRSSDSGVKD